jgi:hypothetical protein
LALAASAAAAGTPAASLSTTAISFPGTQGTGSVSASQAVTVTNLGGAALTLGGVFAGGPDPQDFLVDATNCAFATPLGPGGSCQVFVRFVPQTKGAKSAVLNVVDNAGNSPQTVALSGRGGSPPKALAVVIAAGSYRARAGSSLAMRFATSLRSSVTVRVLKGTRVLLSRSASAGEGHNALKITGLPRSGGHYTVQLVARAHGQTASDHVALTLTGARHHAPAPPPSGNNNGSAVGGGGTD